MAKVVKIEPRRPGWWGSRTVRERRLLLFMFALVFLVVAWFLVLRPLQDARAAADERLAAATTKLGDARAQALVARRDLRGPTADQAPLPLPLDGFIAQAAADQGFTNIQATAQAADRVRIVLASAQAQAFLAWIGQLERRGVIVESMNIRANIDQTVAVDAVLRAGGRS